MKNNESDSHLERRIVTACILNTKFLKMVYPLIKVKWFKSEESRRIAGWCVSYFRKYSKAPKKEIQNIYLSKIKNLDTDSASLIEDTLFSLSKQFKKKKNKIDVEYLFDETEKYLKKRQLQNLINSAQEELDSGDLTEATLIASNFTPIQRITSNAIIPLSTSKGIREVYEDQFTPLFTYGDTPLGNMINRTLCKGCFVSILAQNKGGKSFTLMDMGMRAINAGCNVVYFQAGDMTQKQQERRQGIWLTKKSDMPEYCEPLYIPVLDCVYNQNGDCDFRDRESKFYPFENYTPEQLRGEAETNNIKVSELKERVKEIKNHKPCINCIRSIDSRRHRNFKGTIWYKKRKRVSPLIWKDVYKAVKNGFHKKLSKMRMITYPTEKLTMSMIKQENDILKKQGFFAQVMLIDYMDILAPDTDTKTMSLRDQENIKWARARALSIMEDILIIAPTQADAKSFKQKIVDKSNFTEDKRKLDHVTGMIGINMTNHEKIKGIARYNDIVQREVEGSKIVHVMHRLQTGRPILGSFY